MENTKNKEKEGVLENLVDLHQHLGFSSTPHFLWELAHEQGIRLEDKNYWDFIKRLSLSKNNSWEYYHHLFDLAQKIQSSPYAIEKAVHNAVSYGYRKSNISVLEIRFNPMRRNRGGEHDLDKIILAACVGFIKATLEYPVKGGIIIETDRRFPPQLNKILIDKAISFKKFGVIGIDLSGPENKNFSLKPLIKSFLKAKEAGLGITFHTGERNLEEMEEVIKEIKPHRIGHGVKAVNSKKILELLAENKIFLEICPTSNLSLKIVKNFSEMKKIINIFKKNNILFTINSDAPTLLKTNVKEEFLKLLKHKIISFEEIEFLIKTARKASFINLLSSN